MSDYFIYDLETYPNVFTCVIQHTATDMAYPFEISERRDDRKKLVEFCHAIADMGGYMVGYKSLTFDYPILHELFRNAKTFDWYKEAERCIATENDWDKVIKDPVVPQIDLMKVHHFDNKARSQSLKGLEFAMRMDDIQDLPFAPGTVIPLDQIDNLIEYNKHDVKATRILFDRSIDQINFRHTMSEKYDKDFLNSSDVKIGTDVLIIEAEKHNPGSCYKNGKKQQTIREQINVSEVLLPIIEFDLPEFQEIHEHFKALVVTETKGAIKSLSATVNGFKFIYGLGGLHGSVTSQAFHSDAGYVIIDVDVASYYPNLAIVNDLFPEHLSREFCDVYKSIYEQRKLHAKGTPENAMLKLALNGAYGNSNNPYSPLYDPQYTMAITINGQLLLSMLAERLMTINGLEIIQVNTDGVTVRVPRYRQGHLRTVCRWWEDLTHLSLESVEFDSMFIRDVNNFLCTYGDKVKRKGAYEYNYQLHQDPSATIVAMAAEAHLVHGTPVEEFIHTQIDPCVFAMRAKMTGKNRCYHGTEQQQKLTRFHMATSGDTLRKWMPATGPIGCWKKANGVVGTPSLDGDGELDAAGIPHDPYWHTKNKSKYQDRESVIASGCPVVICNRIKDFNWGKLEYQYYIDETKKLTEVFK